jgi:hypothetical protein
MQPAQPQQVQPQAAQQPPQPAPSPVPQAVTRARLPGFEHLDTRELRDRCACEHVTAGIHHMRTVRALLRD